MKLSVTNPPETNELSSVYYHFFNKCVFQTYLYTYIIFVHIFRRNCMLLCDFHAHTILPCSKHFKLKLHTYIYFMNTHSVDIVLIHENCIKMLITSNRHLLYQHFGIIYIYNIFIKDIM